jgi:hypothetical protein
MSGRTSTADRHLNLLFVRFHPNESSIVQCRTWESAVSHCGFAVFVGSWTHNAVSVLRCKKIVVFTQLTSPGSSAATTSESVHLVIAISGLMPCSKQYLYSITSSARFSVFILKEELILNG